jgi:phosphoglycolate phosphatase-like HAD superfamily hydrolase
MGTRFRGGRRAAPRSRIHYQIGKGSDRLIPEFVEDGEASDRASELHGDFYAKLQDRGYPLPGAKELLASIADRGYEVWFATSAKPEDLEHHMEELEAEGKVAGWCLRRRSKGPNPRRTSLSWC